MKAVLYGKKILLGVCGGIAAYKTAFLVRLLKKQGAEVQIVLTPAALDFITPLTLSTLSENPALSTFTNDTEAAQWNNHVDLALWADFMLIAPTTANTLSKMANGTVDNLLLAVYLSAKCPVFFAPAMDLDMYKHPSTLKNIKILKSFGNILIPAEKGFLASGLEGEGRMAEPENIIIFLENYFLENLPLRGKKVLITAGPTYESLDPVRFIGNHSTGKMGYALAEVAAQNGAEVVLVSGPSFLQAKHPFIETIRVTSAEEMLTECLQVFDTATVAICAAAVADYRPKNIATQKIKKNEANFTLELEKTTDILYTLGTKKQQQYVVGFALETENEIENAILKIKKKNLNLIVLNSLNDAGAGFATDSNKVTLINNKFEIQPLALQSKTEVAHQIINTIIENI